MVEQKKVKKRRGKQKPEISWCFILLPSKGILFHKFFWGKQSRNVWRHVDVIKQTSHWQWSSDCWANNYQTLGQLFWKHSSNTLCKLTYGISKHTSHLIRHINYSLPLTTNHLFLSSFSYSCGPKQTMHPLKGMKKSMTIIYNNVNHFTGLTKTINFSIPWVCSAQDAILSMTIRLKLHRPLLLKGSAPSIPLTWAACNVVKLRFLMLEASGYYKLPIGTGNNYKLKKQPWPSFFQVPFWSPKWRSQKKHLKRSH